MTFDDLKYFFEIARAGNYSRAAANLNITQPNLTKHVARLEQEIGIRLFDRSTHHCRLTEEGAVFMHRTEDLFFRLTSSIEDTRLRSKSQYRQIYIGIAAGERAPGPVAAYIRELNTGSSTHRYVVQQDNYASLNDKLDAHDYDVIITTDRNVRTVPQFRYTKLGDMRLLLAVHRSNPKSENPDLTPGDCLDEIVFLSLPDGKYAPPSRIGDFNRRAGADLNLTILPSPADILDNIRLCSGVGIVPSTVDPALHPDVAFYDYEEPRDDVWQTIVWRKDETNPAVLDFVENVCRLMAPGEDGGAGVRNRSLTGA